MLRALRTDVVRVDLTLIADNPDDGSPQVLDYRGGRYIARPNTMVYLRIEVANLACSLFSKIFVAQLAKLTYSVTSRDDTKFDY
jgi:hypothetical protein